ncbi:TetR/AcrR family transcriptional regulator [Micromonospora echinofusca]|uniref:TetR family transcriptional regulator n=1 Tax=Micromonospora echinofusca TaxID=47858 RepID=A0ABS3VXF1_MICEH|nr:TetR/AcrR family transcriptional regulator [Micromonospora echinofusca]MBO4209225.1 TetR family transcriptional regulator [Micromonospora echinofusca]
MSDDRLERILDAAYRCFTRHGMRRTTMDDIATAAGMSRPAVYQYVRNKDDAYRRLAAGLFDRSLTQARAAADATAPLDDRLHGVLAAKLELTLQLWRDSPPHAAELLDASARLTGDLAGAYTRELTDLVTMLVADTAGDRARSFAELAVALTRGLEADLTDPELPRRRLREGVTLLVAGLTHQE